MAGYGYAPPPPPPSAAGGQQGYGHQPAPAYASQQRQGRGGGPSGRGRGGHYSNGHQNPPQPAPYEYSGQPYPGHQAAPYGGSQPPPANYSPGQPQWRPEHSQQGSHAPAPISAANYHPNYAHQPYQPPQPPYPQQPAYGAPTQPYPQPYQQQPPPQQWGGQGHPAPYGNGRSQRGGYNDHGGFDHNQPPPMSYGQPYPPNPQASYPPPFQYAPPPPPPASGFQGNNYGSGGGRRNDRGGKFKQRGGNQTGQRPPKHNLHNNDRSGGARVKSENNHNQNAENHNAGKKKKRKTNTLGLTPGMESDSEDDENEEKTLPRLLGAEQYEVTDLAQFLKERRANFPTKARAEAKKAQATAAEEESQEKLLEKKRDKLRRQLAMVESSIKRKRELGDEGDEMRDLSLNDSEDDEKPDVESTQKPAAPAPPPPARKADVKKHCKYYSTGGSCGKKSKCRFVHDPATREAAIKEREQNNGNLTISQRLILNDKDQEDLAILESIQYLRDRGVMKKEASAGKDDSVKPGKAIKEEGTDGEKIAAPVAPPPLAKTSLLPAASASLPPPPPKREVAPRKDHGQSKQKPLPASLPTPVSAGSQPPSSSWLQEEYKPSGNQGQNNLP